MSFSAFAATYTYYSSSEEETDEEEEVIEYDGAKPVSIRFDGSVRRCPPAPQRPSRSCPVPPCAPCAPLPLLTRAPTAHNSAPT